MSAAKAAGVVSSRQMKNLNERIGSPVAQLSSTTDAARFHENVIEP
jgi:hypothetical protein